MAKSKPTASKSSKKKTDLASIKKKKTVGPRSGSRSTLAKQDGNGYQGGNASLVGPSGSNKVNKVATSQSIRQQVDKGSPSNVVNPYQQLNLTYELNKSMKYPPKVLYITSFAEDMYQATGKRLINSFLDTLQSGDLLVCAEDVEIEEDDPKIKTYKLESDFFLNDWLENHLDIIPAYLGGEATKESCPLAYETKWNSLASRWFRKVASMRYACQTYGNSYQYLVWVDSDCEFKETIPLMLYPAVLEGYAMFYYFGDYRKRCNSGYETGFLGFNLLEGGSAIIDEWVEMYQNRRFLDYNRWDDGYIIRMYNEDINLDKIPTHDIAMVNEHNPMGYPNYFRKYIVHKKGYHQKINVMQT